MTDTSNAVSDRTVRFNGSTLFESTLVALAGTNAGLVPKRRTPPLTYTLIANGLASVALVNR